MGRTGNNINRKSVVGTCYAIYIFTLLFLTTAREESILFL